jgi:hypothetical protein
MRDEEVQYQPPTAEQVARRALILSAVVCRGSIDRGPRDAEIDGLPARITKWLENARLTDHVEPWEAEVLSAPLGELDEQSVYRATWAVEGLAVLAWALRQGDLPRHDQAVNSFDVAESVGFLCDDAVEFMNSTPLRAPIELHDCRELMYVLHCRLRAAIRNRACDNFPAWLEEEWLHRLRLNRDDLIVDGDLSIGQTAIGSATPEAIQRCEWAIHQRHRASIWLIGEEQPDYWAWGVDT